jgi:CRISPR system Cascade subunit CasD
MASGENTLLLRLAGPMQSWGTSSRCQLRRTDLYPSKSGVLGMMLCAKGISRRDSPKEIEALTTLRMGVRVDRGGISDWDYHTAGARIGIRKAEGGIKKTASTGEYETLLSRRQYLYDASFLVALCGATDAIRACARALDNPVWPIFLGRKCCVPSEPIFVGTGLFQTVSDALASVPWTMRIDSTERIDSDSTRTLDTFIEHPPGVSAPGGARLVYDVPRAFGFNNYGPRWIVRGQVTVPVAKSMQRDLHYVGTRRVDYKSPQWKAARLSRLKLDHHLCIFCKSPAEEVHHVDYTNVGCETDSDLRSLCKLCHDACTILEYGHDMETRRVDPSAPAQRQEILQQINRLLSEPRLGRRRKLLETARKIGPNSFDDEYCFGAKEGR